MEVCPVCRQRAIGKVGTDQYYCWDCCIEFVLSGPDIKIFNVEVDGSLTQYGECLQDTVNTGTKGVI